MVALLSLIVIDQVVVPLSQATFFTAVAPSNLPLSLVRVQAPAEPPSVKISVPEPNDVIVFLSEAKVEVTVSIKLLEIAPAVKPFVLDAITI